MRAKPGFEYVRRRMHVMRVRITVILTIDHHVQLDGRDDVDRDCEMNGGMHLVLERTLH